MIRRLIKYLVKFVFLFLGAFPPSVHRGMSKVLAFTLYGIYRLTPQRNFIFNNLKMAFQDEKSDKELHRLAFKNICHISRSIFEILRNPFLNDAKLRQLIKVEGLENLEEVARLGRGIVSVTAHFGNWELVGAITASLGYPPYGLVVRQAGVIDEIISEYRLAKGVVGISRWNSLRQVLRLLKDNKNVGALNDQHGEYNNLILEFFGQKVSVPAGPANFAILGKTAMVPVFMVRQADDTHVIYYEPPIYPDPGKNKKENVVIMSAKYMAVLERFIRTYPEQWFWVYNRFDKLPPSVSP